MEHNVSIPRWVGIAVVVVGLSLFGACASRRGADGVPRLVPASRPYVSDIPVPAGFKLVDRSSEDWSAGSLRYLRHRYVGRADKHAAREFYRDQMPLVRWTGLSDGNVHGRYTMQFERDGESCSIVISEGGVGIAARVTVDVLITPKGK
ncbi:MAG: hypothetical protein JSU63_18370 [Phycisphaerales bacterium]|nr:MAG: hypothetical protein JSU63_18370 [Phycisphaerales bacterium]